MDVRFYHPEFNQIILECFKEIISEFKFRVEPLDEKDSFVELVNDKCILEFGYEVPFVSSSFVDPKEKAIKEKTKRNDGFPVGYPHYLIFSVWNFLYPFDSDNFSHSNMNIEEQALVLKRLILTRLKNVLKGDFSWIPDYGKNNTRISKKIEYMHNHWALDNPVRIRFNNGDPEWEKAFDEYKNYLDNLQK